MVILVFIILLLSISILAPEWWTRVSLWVLLTVFLLHCSSSGLWSFVLKMMKVIKLKIQFFAHAPEIFRKKESSFISLFLFSAIEEPPWRHEAGWKLKKLFCSVWLLDKGHLLFSLLFTYAGVCQKFWIVLKCQVKKWTHALCKIITFSLRRHCCIYKLFWPTSNEIETLHFSMFAGWCEGCLVRKLI